MYLLICVPYFQTFSSTLGVFLNMLHILSIVFIKQGHLFTAHDGGGIMLWFSYMPGLNFISLCYWV